VIRAVALCRQAGWLQSCNVEEALTKVERDLAPHEVEMSRYKTCPPVTVAIVLVTYRVLANKRTTVWESIPRRARRGSSPWVLAHDTI